jgi:hypothetical protein
MASQALPETEKQEIHDRRSHGMNRHTHEHQSLWRIFRWPLLLGLSSAIGLSSALLGDGVWDTLSWITLFVPVAVIAWFCRRARR